MQGQKYAEEPQNEGNNHQQEQSVSTNATKQGSTKTPRRVRSSRKSASAFRTISEVAEELDVQQHVLRFWETKFSQIRPLKRGGGRRYYRPEDIDLLKRIHHLLYTEGYTIKGVQKLLKEQGKKAFLEESKPVVQEANNNAAKAPAIVRAVDTGLSNTQREALKGMLSELKELREIVSSGE